MVMLNMQFSVLAFQKVQVAKSVECIVMLFFSLAAANLEYPIVSA